MNTNIFQNKALPEQQEPAVKDPDETPSPMRDEPWAPELPTDNTAINTTGQNLADDNDGLSDDDDLREDRSHGTRSDLSLEESKRSTPNPLPAHEPRDHANTNQ